MRKVIGAIMTAYAAVSVFASDYVLTAVTVPDAPWPGVGITVFGSRLSDEGAGVIKVRQHGDTLSVEAYRDRRGWYVWRGDTALFAGGETFDVIEWPDTLVEAFSPSFVQGKKTDVEFTMLGTASKVWNRVPGCGYVSETGRRGAVVLPEGDTLRGVTVVREMLTVPVDSVATGVRETVRWFGPNDRRPLAIYVVEKYMEGGELVASEEHCHAISSESLERRREELPPEDELTDILAESLASATVKVSGGYIEVECDFPSGGDGCDFTVGVTDVPGHLFAYETCRASGEVRIRIPTSGLRPGEYIVGLSLSNPVLNDKRYIIVGP